MLGVVSLAVIVLVSCLHSAIGQVEKWQPIGPEPNTNGQVEGINEGEVEGAVEAIAPHPVDPNTVFVGAVNGGLWVSRNAMSTNPIWQELALDAKSLSIGALEFDPTDPMNRTLVAGFGHFSSFLGLGGELRGILKTTDGGVSWSSLDGGGALRGINVNAVAPRGDIILLAANNAGVLRSHDGGVTWQKVSGQTGAGLPAGRSFDLIGYPTSPGRLFTNAGTSGIYRTDDLGVSWVKVSDSQVDAVLAQGADNVRIAVGNSADVYLAISVGGRLGGVFRSGDGGTHWASLDVPKTTESAGPVGINPGAQGSLHLSIAADPVNPNIVYVGGDRQPAANEGAGGNPTWPNSIGASDYSGRLFRLDASLPVGQQATPITHSFTQSASAPHADSRRMRFAANGVLIEADDGGIYRRSDPRSKSGDWFSMNGNILTTELHSAAWDANVHIAIGGAQDTGSPEETHASAYKWSSVSTGDGGVVVVDSKSSAGSSTRYTSYFNLFGFRRQVYDSNNELQSELYPRLLVMNGGSALLPQFYTPIALNAVVPTRIIIGAANSVYESRDQGDTLVEIGPRVAVNASGPIAYGVPGNPDLLYVSAENRVFIRASSSQPLSISAAYPGTGQVMGIALDPGKSISAYVVDGTKVYRTTDTGATWADITGSLPKLDPGNLLAVTYITNPKNSGVVVAASHGVFIAHAPGLTDWSGLGADLPRALVLHLEYDAVDDLLLATTLGRGAWVLPLADQKK